MKQTRNHICILKYKEGNRLGVESFHHSLSSLIHQLLSQPKPPEIYLLNSLKEEERIEEEAWEE